MKTLAVILALAALVVACSAQGPAAIMTVGNGEGSADVKIIKLDDGTRCAVLIGAYKAAISCDWK